ncbi:MAG: class I SAM-dependent methyltransferase, partial [Bacteroidota bacterium]
MISTSSVSLGKACEVCGDKYAKPLFAVNHINILECHNCQHRYADFIPTEDTMNSIYGDEYFFGGKDGYPDYLKNQDVLIKRGESYSKIINQFRTPGRVLDIGSAAGFILKGFENQGWQGVGVEPNQVMSRYANETLGLEVINTSFEAFETNEPFDLVSMIQVISHVSDIKQCFEKLTALTADQGYLLIESWNENSLMARLFGKRWHQYAPPSVLRWFNCEWLQAQLKKYGFEFVKKGRLTKYIQADHIKSLLQFKFEGSALKPAV